MDQFLEQVADAIREMPLEKRAEVERLSKDPDTKMMVYLISRKLPYLVVSKMSIEQKRSVGAIVAEILGEAELWTHATEVEPLVLSKS